MGLKAKVSVIIPTWQGRELLKTCLRQLSRQTFAHFQTVVVDNGSTDGTVRMVRELYPRTKIIRLKTNLGFAAAVNQGVLKTKTKYFALLNNDIQVGPRWLEMLVATLDQKPQYAACAPKQLSAKDPCLFDGAGDEINIVGQAKARGHSQRDRGQYDQEEEIFAVSAGASLYRREVWREIGPFADQFFAYFEDLDWCFRARLTGHRFYYQPKAIVYHEHQTTSSRDPKKLAYLTFRNTNLCLFSNFPTGLFSRRWRWLKIPLVHLNTIWYLARDKKLCQALAAEAWIIGHFWWLLKRRRLIQARRKISVAELEGWMKPKKITFWGFLR